MKDCPPQAGQFRGTEGYDEFPFTADGARRRIFTRGSGPGVVIMHELPGLSPQCLDLGRRLACDGFQVFLPLMFGEPGQHSGALGDITRFCLVKEFRAFASDQSQPITAWMRALCGEVNTRTGGQGIAVMGLCLSGGLVFALIAEKSVRAAVSSEPAVPIPLTADGRSALGISPEELGDSVARVEAEGIPLLGLRFSDDWLCPRERFDRLALEFSRGFAQPPEVINSDPGNAAGISPRSHSVLTDDFVDEPGHPTRRAYDRVVGFLKMHLAPLGAPGRR